MTNEAQDLRTGDKIRLFGFVCTIKSVSPDPKDPDEVVRVQFGDDVAVAGSGSGEIFYNRDTVVNMAA
jgi:hypothetical protein